MFLGRYEHTIDIKGRLAVPAKFRTGLVEGMFVTRWIDKCLALIPAPTFYGFAEKISSLPILDPNARFLRRSFFSDAASCDVDKQGRIIIPTDLRSYAGISTTDSTVVLIGVNTYIEIWNKDKWSEIQQKAEADDEALISAFSSLGQNIGL